LGRRARYEALETLNAHPEERSAGARPEERSRLLRNLLEHLSRRRIPLLLRVRAQYVDIEYLYRLTIKKQKYQLLPRLAWTMYRNIHLRPQAVLEEILS
jgi:hypothetical protein